MNYSSELDRLLHQLAHIKYSVAAAATQSREQRHVDETPFLAGCDEQAREEYAKVAAEEADRAEGDALHAIDFAARTLDNARLAILDAIDGRAHADAQASRPS
jgi:hypothetical protein